MSALTNYWQSLKSQEQRLLLIAGAVFVVFFFVMVVYRPLNNAIEDAKQDQLKQQELLQFVQQSVVKLKAKGAVANTGGKNVTQIVNRTRGRYQIAISRMQPSGDGLRVNIDSVPFNQLLAWLDELVNNHGVSIANIELSQDQKPGHVRVSRIVLE
ncbi:type II secretion system protein M [Pseudoalteromonas sp. CNC9-20]|uniref:type II secretion system protein GspM n=1 Tax=Pseudoalteromonas sp. CNC9-20 TaxID=2917750 RepID=UPI001EF4CCB3|nr:type II secretion system protein M [Pseudoalteromonas sp. CNC9-20]MCG7570362.1 type II secretion system protein M [Pseudoalteromonas sp. CNC9-20]